nr:MAG TPA_asm: hypothetical protein [Caudoviricetes sp.]
MRLPVKVGALFFHFNKSKSFSCCRKDPTRIYTYMATDRIFILNRVSCWYVGVLVVKSAFLENEKKISPDVNFYARIYIYGNHSHFYSEFRFIFIFITI